MHVLPFKLVESLHESSHSYSRAPIRGKLIAVNSLNQMSQGFKPISELCGNLHGMATHFRSALRVQAWEVLLVNIRVFSNVVAVVDVALQFILCDLNFPHVAHSGHWLPQGQGVWHPPNLMTVRTLDAIALEYLGPVLSTHIKDKIQLQALRPRHLCQILAWTLANWKKDWGKP